MRWLVAMAAAMLAAGNAGAVERAMLPADVRPISYDVHVVPDAAAMTFRGQVTDEVMVERPIDRIVLNAAELDIDRATIDGGQPLKVDTDAAAQTITIHAGRTLAPGRHTLAIAWHGAISKFTSGLFAIDYDGPAGAERLVATKFEPAAARRFMPLWDEPAAKATYRLTATVPAGDLAISNTPIAETKTLPGELKQVRFQPTPKMSSYLLFFGTGPFERIHRQVGNVDVGVIVRRGAGERGRFALDAAAAILPYYNEYFGTPYPLPKLDLIASPGAGSFSAMENWGAIFFFENALLIGDQSSPGERRGVWSTVAHEMAHQWFGDLVTMNWWDDLWLNEGFASWMKGKAMARLHPEWRPDLLSQTDRESALELDALPGTHPVIQDVRDGPAANQAFDRITYGKGQAVIGMLEAFVGADKFRDGVRAYMRDHAYANTVNDDLWSAVEQASGQPVKAIAADFLKQPGIPLVTVTGDGKLGEARFSFASEDREGRWQIPLRVRAAGQEKALLLTPAGASATPPVVANAGQAAYARVAYDEAAFAPLARDFAALPDADRLGLLLDGWALGQAGTAPAWRLLALTEALAPDAEPILWTQAAAILSDVDRLHAAGPARDAFRGWARARLAPVLARIGWDARANEPATAAVLRDGLIRLLGHFGDKDVIAEARRREAAGATGALAKPVLAVVAENADATTFARLRARAKAEKDPQAKADLYAAITRVADPALAKEALAVATNGEAPGSLAANMVAAVAVTHPDLAWTHALATADTVAPNLDLRQRYQYLPRVAQPSLDPARADALHAIAERDFPADARRFADQAEKAMRQRAEVARLRVPEIDRWIAGRR